MRTDAKIGFAIVGVLLAVLAVYAVVIPRHKKMATAPVADGGVKLVTPETGVSVPPANEPPGVDVTPPVSVPPLTPSAPPKVADPTPILPQNLLPKPPAGNDATVRGDDRGNGLFPTDGGFHPAPLTGGGAILPEPPARNAVADGTAHGGRSAPHRRRTITADDTAQVATAADHTYTVRPGQTLSSIAAEVYGNSRYWSAIQRANHNLQPSHLKVGTSINVPDITAVRPEPAVVVQAADVEIAGDPVESSVLAGQTYRVQAGDSLYKIAKRVLGSGRRADALYELNRGVIGPNMGRLRKGMVLRLPSAPSALSDASR